MRERVRAVGTFSPLRGATGDGERAEWGWREKDKTKSERDSSGRTGERGKKGGEMRQVKQRERGGTVAAAATRE